MIGNPAGFLMMSNVRIVRSEVQRVADFDRISKLFHVLYKKNLSNKATYVLLGTQQQELHI